MKFNLCSSSCLRRTHLFSWVAALLLLLTSCHQEINEIDEFELAPALAEEFCGEEGESVDFPMDVSTSGLGDADYGVNIETGPYQSTDCLCKVRNYELIFTDYNPEWALTITDLNGNPVAFDLVVDEETGRAMVLILDPGKLLDQDLSILIHIDNEDEDQDPTLVQAGGLCIVENVIINQGIPIGVNAPLILFDSTTTPLEDPIRMAYIPTSIGGAPY